MADLKTFAAFDINTLYTDVADSEKGFHGAHATMVHNGYASPPVGAVNLDNPGGTTRSLTQWNGAAYVGFNANSPGGYQAPTYYFNLANCFAAQDIGTGNPGFLFDAGDYMDYNRTSNAWRVAIGSADVLSITTTQTNTLTNSTLHQSSATLFKYSINTSAPANQKTWAVLQNTSELVSFVQSDSGALSPIYDRITRSGAAITTRALNESSGRLLVGPAAPDDGVTALQTTSYSASNQPSLTGGSNPTALSIPVNTSPPLQIPTRTLKGGMIVYNSDQNIAVPVAGLYLLSGKILFNVAVQSTRVIVSLFKNASLFNYQSDFPPIPGNTYIVDLNAQIPMLASDVIILTATVNSAGSTPSAARITDLSFTKIN